MLTSVKFVLSDFVVDASDEGRKLLIGLVRRQTVLLQLSQTQLHLAVE
jgi:hypothetical protein